MTHLKGTGISDFHEWVCSPLLFWIPFLVPREDSLEAIGNPRKWDSTLMSHGYRVYLLSCQDWDLPSAWVQGKHWFPGRCDAACTVMNLGMKLFQFPNDENWFFLCEIILKNQRFQNNFFSRNEAREPKLSSTKEKIITIFMTFCNGIMPKRGISVLVDLRKNPT